MEIGRAATTGEWYGTADFGVRATTVDGDQARFQRYRDLRSGLYGTNALAGRRTQDWTLEAQAWNIGYRDQRYQLDFQRVGRLTGFFQYDQIPLYISADTETLYSEMSPGVFRIEDTIQQQIQSGAKTIRDFEDQAAPFELRTMRRVGTGDVVFNASPNTDISIYIRNTNRDGHIPFGGTFGFSNAVEIPAPINTRTTDVRTALQWANAKGMVRVGWDGSSFTNNLDSVVWDNPLRFTDTTSAPSQGRHASWPGNTLTYVHGTGAISLPGERQADRLRRLRPGAPGSGPAPVHHQHCTGAAAARPHHRAGRVANDGCAIDIRDASRTPVRDQRALSLCRLRRAVADLRPLAGQRVVRHQAGLVGRAVGVSQRPTRLVRCRRGVRAAAVYLAEGWLQQPRL